MDENNFDSKPDSFDFEFDFDFGDSKAQKTGKQEKEKPKDTNEENHVRVHQKMGFRNITRKVASEKALEESMPWHFKNGESYHCFSFGDVDSFTYLRMVARQQPIKYLALSTWCMAGEDVLELEEWHKKGIIGRVDFFMGEIFKGSYPMVYDEVKKFIKECGGRLVIFRNHSKVMAIKGERFDCLIESSANVNTNPRSENTVLTIDTELTDTYVKLFSEIVPFNDDYNAEPYKL